MRDRVDRDKRDEVARYEIERRNKIKDFDFKRGALVLVRNSEIESSLDKKLKPRYNGPYIVLRRTKGGAYIICELDGSVLQSKIAAFRVLPYHARARIELPLNFEELTGRTEKDMDLIEDEDKDVNYRDYIFEGIRLRGEKEKE
ncbi:hypothetical protein BDN72DRAFT_728950, partial [Pluteus cervinus]